MIQVNEAEQRDNRRTTTADDDDRAWLEARLAEYRELLTYLREH
jgi:hypothetical protein